MIKYTTIILLIISTTAFGQSKDKRAELNLRGRVSEISVSPDEKIWLTTAMGNMYYTNSIDSNWHYTKAIFESKDELNLDQPRLERISFFNKDTAIITGYISGYNEEFKKNGFYRTTNGGEDWKLLDFGGDSWIYDIFISKTGHAWMGGSSGQIYYSNDYGENWTKLNSPYNSSSRMHSIFMKNEKVGVSGSLGNRISITHNNWKSSKKIPSPFDKKIHQSKNNRIEKIILWKDYIVVLQGAHVYYSDNKIINWQKFKTELIDFELDIKSEQLYGVSDGLEIFIIDSPTSFRLLTKQKLSIYPLNIAALNNCLFMVGDGYDDVFKVDSTGIKHNRLYTTDRKISEPRISKQYKKLIWGINGNQIYISEGNSKDWYRENVLDFYVENFQLKSDSLAILWDGKGQNYFYSLSTHTVTPYSPKEPLKRFFAYPIESLTIESGSNGCFHHYSHNVEYQVQEKAILSCNKFSKSNDTLESQTFKNELSAQALEDILRSISKSPSAIPTIRDFNITEQDKENYLALIDKEFKSFSRRSRKKQKFEKEFYSSFPNTLDTLDNSIIINVLNQYDGVWSTTTNWFITEITNFNNDKIQILSTNYVKSSPWNLPWIIQFDGLHFYCYDIELSKFIDSCVPDGFLGKKSFDNKHLIMDIAEYLNRQK